MRRVTVPLSGGRSYDAVVGHGILSRLPRLVSTLDTRRGFLIADAALAAHAKIVEKLFRNAGWQFGTRLVPAGEGAKDYRKAFSLFTDLIVAGLDRKSVVFALGGGVIGDLAGFVAGTYLRGIRWVGIPTTLLAQVDSSLGGKTGVNHPLGKNLIGAFHQPSLVVCDTALLKSLSERDRLSGLGEIVKYGLAFDPSFFHALTKKYDRILTLSPKETEWAVARSLEWKARVVAKDEHETTGLRRTLNFGHTLGHALEAMTGYRRYRHGEAIITGMRLASALSTIRGFLPPGELETIEDFLDRLDLVPPPRGLSLEKVMAFVRRDKKAKEGKVTFVLLKRIGKTVPDDGVTADDIRAAFALLELPLR